MKTAAREQRMLVIETCAMEVLEEAGYEGMSMLAVARRAKASNETLYRWYGDKRGLFKSLVARNAGLIRENLEAASENSADPVEALRVFGPMFLKTLLSKSAIALNRAAAADVTGELGNALSEAGRESVLPVLRTVLTKAQSNGFLSSLDDEDALKTYINVLVGDQQIRVVTHAAPVPGNIEIERHVEFAWQILRKI